MPKKRSVTLTLHVDRDADILAWLESQPNRSEAMRAAIRSHLAGDDVTLADVMRELRALRRAGLVAAPVAPSREPADAAANLATLGL